MLCHIPYCSDDSLLILIVIPLVLRMVPPEEKIVISLSTLLKVPESAARSVISTRTFRRAPTASLDSCAEIRDTTV